MIHRTRLSGRVVSALIAVILSPGLATAQSALAGTEGAPLAVSASASVTGSGSGAAPAHRTAVAPVIDGLADDSIWREVPPVTDFVQLEPTEGIAPSQRTQFQVAYDRDAMYVLVRAFDTSPDSLMHALARRDVSTASDEIRIGIDSYHDRRSGFVFGVNVSGVKRDIALYNDGNQSNSSWDPVWEAATSVDSLGWIAEFRIPFSQLRFPPSDSHTFGLAVARDIRRLSERSMWPATFSRNQQGESSQWAVLTGLDGIADGRTIEAIPYLVARDRTVPLGAGDFGRARELDVGLDLRSRLAPNFTLAATVNPDFGQVEADPAVLNLGAFEVFQSEKRPFFVEGTGSYRFQLNCYSVVDCSTNEGLFYSRRIGRSPALREVYGDAGTPGVTPIAAAAKLTGRTGGGLNIGAMTAITRGLDGTQGRTVEPRAVHAVLSAEQDFRAGDAGIRVVATGVRRSVDEWTAPYLHSEAYATAVSFRSRFGGRSYEFAGLIAGSRVVGSAEAIAATQRSSVHYFQQPDDDLSYDANRTSLSGFAGELKVGKYSGGITRFETSLVHHSAGFDVNDLGFLRRSDRTEWSTWGSLVFNTPTRISRWMNLNANAWNGWNTSGDRIQTGINLNGHVGLHNFWDIHAGFTLDNLGGSLCDRCTRGGPLLARSPSLRPWWRINGDSREAIIPSIRGEHTFADGGRTRFVGIFPSVDLRFSSRFDAGVGASYRRNTDAAQWVGNFSDDNGAIHHVFARLDQSTVAFALRMNYTHTPALGIQFYGEPFVSRGNYTDFREVSETPRADRYEDRFSSIARPLTAATGVHFRQMNANLVVRWEYAPGSTLFVAWAHGRQGFEGIPSEISWADEFDGLFGIHPDNTFVIKVAHWLNW